MAADRVPPRGGARSRPNRSAAAKVIELEKTIRDRIEASRPKPAIDKLREQARAMGQPVINLQERLPKLVVQQRQPEGHPRLHRHAAPGSTSPTSSTFRDVPYTINLEDVTVEQALQQIMLANTLFYKVVNPKTIMVIPDNAANRSKYEDIVVRVFYISHGDAPEIATIINSMTRITTMPVQPQVLPNKTANTITVRATARGRGDHRADHPRERQAARRSGHRRADPRGEPRPGEVVRPESDATMRSASRSRRSWRRRTRRRRRSTRRRRRRST